MKKKKILIVDDDGVFLRTMARLLSSAGYDTYPLSDGRLAFKTVRKVMPDLIILDVVMPGIDGFKIKTKLNESAPTANIPVIFLTVKKETFAKVKGFHLGADDYILKPFNSEELLARIDGLLNKKSFYEKISMTLSVNIGKTFAAYAEQFAVLCSFRDAETCLLAERRWNIFFRT